MMFEKLNIVFIGQQTFPEGTATTKRRRYMVDYLNSNKISTRILITFYHNSQYTNPKEGYYGDAQYVSIHDFAAKGNIVRYYKEGKRILREWLKPECKNVLIFPTVLSAFDFPFYLFARKLGYYVVFDQVETSYLKSGELRLATKLYYYANEILSKIAYKKTASFVISSFLYNQTKSRYPNIPVEILPNSTPVLSDQRKYRFNDVLQVLYSGTYGEKEGVSFLIEGVLDAVSKGCDCKLILLGNAPGKLRESYSKNKSIDFRGFISEDELRRLLVESDVLAMVRTNSEFANYGFPFKLSEYLATGNVVIATNVGDVGKYLTDRNNAYLIEPENSSAISDILRHISDNQNEALQIAAKGFETMKEKFSIQSVGDIFVRFLNNL